MSHEPVVKKHHRKPRRGGAPKPKHKNKYAYMAPKKSGSYDSHDKTYRDLLIAGQPGETISVGTTIIWHKRRYKLKNNVVFDKSGHATASCKLA